LSKRTPLFHAHHAERYGRQGLISEYERLTGASLIVVIDQIFPVNITLRFAPCSCDAHR
jgi:hypothetical protein